MGPPVRVQVSHLLGTPGRTDRRRWDVPLMVEMPVVRAGRARADLVLEGTHDGIRLSGTVAVDAQVSCYRCLEEWEEERVVPLDRTVRRLPDSDGYCITEDGWLRLDGIVVDEVVLSLPTAPLCENDCRGICSGCGVHLNTEACKCVVEDRTSPFSVLANFL